MVAADLQTNSTKIFLWLWRSHVALAVCVTFNADITAAQLAL